MQLSCLPQPNSYRDDPTIFNIFNLIPLSLIAESKKYYYYYKKFN